MWEIDSLSQVLGFLYSAVLGVIYSVIYDVLRALRKEIKHSVWGIFAEDIIYSLVCAFMCFCFLLSVTGGAIRFFVMAGICLGFVLSRYTLSKLTFFVFKSTVRFLVFLYRGYCGILSRFFALCDRVIGQISVKIQNLLKNIVKHSKKA